MSLFDTLWQGAQGVAALPLNSLTGDLRAWDQDIFPDAAAQAAQAAGAGQAAATQTPADQPIAQAAGPSLASQFVRGPFMRAAKDLGQALTNPMAAAQATSPPGTLPGTPPLAPARPRPTSAAFVPPEAPRLNLAPAPRGGPGVAPSPAPATFSGFPAAQPTAQPALFTLPVLSPQDAAQLPPGTHFVTTDARVMRRT